MVINSRANAWWKNFSNNKVPESVWKDNFCMSGKSFYKLCTKLLPYFQKKQTRLGSPKSVEVQVASFLYHISDEWVLRKLRITLNYNYKVLAIIKRVFYTITTVLRPELIKLPTNENELKKLADNFLETHEFAQCVRTMDGPDIERAE